MKEYISSFDLAAVLSEIKEECLNSRINNIYQLDSIFILKIRTQKRTLNVVMEPEKRVHITKYRRNKPKIPPNFCMTLRKYLRRKIIIGFEQYKFDRVLIITAAWRNTNPETEKIEYSEKNKLIIEFFDRGIITLLDENDNIIVSNEYKTMKDRRIIPNRKFNFAPIRGVNLFNLNIEKIQSLITDSKKNIVNFIAKDLGIGGTYAEECCLRMGIDKKTVSNQLTDKKIMELNQILNNFMDKIKNKQLNPVLILKDGAPFGFEPFQLKIYEDLQYEEKDNFNMVLDDYFSPQEKIEITEDKLDKKDNLISKQEKIIASQKQAITDLKQKSIIYKRFGDLIYQNMNIIQEIVNSFNQARNNGYSWEEIKTQIQKAKKDKTIPTAKYIGEIKPSEGLFTLRVNSEEISIDFRKSPQENAKYFYETSKKSEKKVKGAKYALEKSTEKLKKIKNEIETISKKPKKLIKKRELKWYEKFHWFYSSNGFLVIGGRDLQTKEILFRKYLEKKDLFLHADFRGSPAVVIKSKSQEIPEKTINEAAQFTVIYSSAWKNKYSNADAYWVEPDQVSQSPPSGQYLPKGSFMIRGKKNYIKNLSLNLAIGLKQKNKYVIPIAGPIDAIEKETSNYIAIIPGNNKRSLIAKEIKRYFIDKQNEKNIINKIHHIPLDEIIRLLPGKAKMIKRK
ncbi:MAG: fibronectin-binding domain-containing protein [Promethearchaeota archaeon]|nr:MAG: fibronectin-binding domain-containing protein [Candidatus Lokiarchaeota archaeon]